MKSVLVIIDGLADVPHPRLGDRTPLAAAHAPVLHYLANRGQTGLLATTFDGFPIESMVCIMGLLGYEPERFYPAGRASFEAMAKGLPLDVDDLVLRCNTVTVDGDGRLVDFTANMISDAAARAFINQVSVPKHNWELYPGQSYRNTLILRGAGVDPRKLRLAEPHMHIGERIESMMPRALEPGLEGLAEQLADFLRSTRLQAAAMELPPDCAANMLWLWSPSVKPVWPSFKQRTGRRAAVVGGLDFLHGIAMAAKIHFDAIPGATGYIDTDYRAKTAYALRYLRDHDFVLVHINSTDEEAHALRPEGKRDAIETIDHLVVAPLLHTLVKDYGESFRIAVCGDHVTRSTDGRHAGDSGPFAVFGTGIEASGCAEFSERGCADGRLVHSLGFLPEVLWGEG